MTSTDTLPVPDPTVLTTAALQREIKALREIIQIQVDNIRTHYDQMMNERDRRYGERFESSQVAVRAAFVASEQAVAAAFEAREKAIQAAYESTEKAILKSEAAQEKRADATFVSLSALQGLLTELMPRHEAESRYANQEQRLSAIGSRIDRMEGKSTGQGTVAAALVAVISLVVAVSAVAVNFSK
jgi:hypothetical protein